MNDTEGIDRDFIEYVVKQIVDEPDAVEVTRSVDDLGVLITLKVGKFDMGKIIGKNGQTAKALRVLLRVIGSKNNARVNLKIIEPDGSEVGGGDFGPAEAPADAPAEEAPVLEEDAADQHADMPDDLSIDDTTPGMEAPAEEAPAAEEEAAPAEEEAPADEEGDEELPEAA